MRKGHWMILSLGEPPMRIKDGIFDTHESELIKSIKSNVEHGDTVVIVGGGYGGTTSLQLKRQVKMGK
jgi:hypothetical protein